MGQTGGEVVEQDDQVLIVRVLRGDTESYNLLAQRWKKRIFNFVYRYTGNFEDSEDLTQETFTKAFRNLARLDDPRRFHSWLYKIALNECRMEHRRNRNHRHVFLDDQPQDGDGEVAPLQLRDPADSPEAIASKRETMEKLKQIFDLIPSEQRVVIVMKEYEDLKFHEIAEILEIPLSTVKSRLYKGLQTLKKMLES